MKKQILVLVLIISVFTCSGMNHANNTEKQFIVESAKSMVQILENESKIFLGGFKDGEGKSIEVEIMPFLLMTNEVTISEYHQFIENSGYTNEDLWSEDGWEWVEKTNRRQPDFWNEQWPDHPDWPVAGVTYYEAEAYSKWIGGRLPTEVEWEAALRGVDGKSYPWGDDWDIGRCNSGDLDLRHPVDVGHYSNYKSQDGINDLLGNVWEWTSEVCEEYPDYPLPKGYHDDMHVLRGGSFQTWEWDGFKILPGVRFFVEPEYSARDVGFRVAKNIKDIKSETIDSEDLK